MEEATDNLEKLAKIQESLHDIRLCNAIADETWLILFPEDKKKVWIFGGMILTGTVLLGGLIGWEIGRRKTSAVSDAQEFLAVIQKYKSMGLSEVEIAHQLRVNVRNLRSAKHTAKTIVQASRGK